jgi:hypothetical protein
MAAPQLLPETESDRVEQWRAQELERAGFSPQDAKQLAQRGDIDLHHTIGLVERGCTHELAMRILL